MATDLIKSDLSIKANQPKEKPYRLNDGKGLVLLINPDGSKYWRLNYTFRNKRKTISIGTYCNGQQKPDTFLRPFPITTRSNCNGD